jgi:hypothetical protein
MANLHFCLNYLKVRKKIHEPQDMAHARKMKTISKDLIFMGKILAKE